MFRKTGTLLAVVAIFACAGGHWAVLQSIAWATMLRDYSQESSLAIAMEKTFSGEFPCSMCKTIAAAKKTERSKPLTVESTKKLETAPLFASTFVIIPPEPDFELSASDSLVPSFLAFDPPTPVPRAA